MTSNTCWNDVENVMAAGLKRVLLYGPSGTGKTYAGLYLGDVSRGAYRLVCTEDMTTFDVLGGVLPNENGGFTFVEGGALLAWRAGARLVIDEVNLASGDVLSLLLSMTDTPESASVRIPTTGEVVKPHPGFSVVLTTNLDDPDDLPDALRDRFPVAILIDQAAPAGLAALPEDLRAIAQNAVGNIDKSQRASLRAFQTFDNLRRSGIDLDNAARLVFGKGEKASAIVTALKFNTVSV
jgi:MoxR-like ATPase